MPIVVPILHQPNHRADNQPAPKTDHGHIPYMADADHGHMPYVTNIIKAAAKNNNFRTAVWTGTHLQTTLMCIEPGGDIGHENHPDTDQMLFVTEGNGLARMGHGKESMSYQEAVSSGSIIFVPAGTWHNVTNTGSAPLKLFTVYAPPHHPFGTVEPRT